jgi:molybdopterin converting factor small subunit
VITVRLPATVRSEAAAEVLLDEPVRTVAELTAVLARRFPVVAERLEDPIYNVAVNDEILLHRVADHPLRDGDVVEFVPTIAGG